VILREEHAAEVTRLKVHAAEIEWMRSEHSAELLRLVEALWHAQDVARDALDRDDGRPTSVVSVLEPALMGFRVVLLGGVAAAASL
jgi:hypothetical protein